MDDLRFSFVDIPVRWDDAGLFDFWVGLIEDCEWVIRGFNLLRLLAVRGAPFIKFE
jgi:hypothetical protein